MSSILPTSIVLVLGTLLLIAFDPLWAEGFAIGGFVGLTGLWILYRQSQGIILNDPTDVQLRFMRGAMIRLPLYAIAFYVAYRLDPATYHPLLAALGGYFTARIVVIYITLTETKH